MKKFINPSARFQGELCGIKTEELKSLNYDLLYIDERMKELEDLLEKVSPFLNEYFFAKNKDEEEVREYYKYSPNTTDELSENINICKYIEMYATYLLNSKDLEKSTQEKYTILSEEEFKKYLSKEVDTDVSVVMDLRPKNDYKNLDLKITKKDLDVNLQNNKYGIREKDNELAAVLNDYEKIREHLKSEMSKIKNGEKSYLTLTKIKSLLSGIIGDMYDAKRMILDLKAPAKRLGEESPTNDFSLIDYNNEEHIKQCLKYCTISNSLRPDDVMADIGYDLYNVINKLYKSGKVDSIDLEIIQCYNSNYTLRDIASEVKRDNKTVRNRLDKICKRIAETI